MNLHSKLLDIWVRLASGELLDPAFEGIPVMVKYLNALHDKELVLKFGSWILRRDPTRGIQIYIHRKDNLFSPKEMLSYLESFGSKCRREYLEYLVFRDASQEREIHTQLAILYLEDLIHLCDVEILQESGTSHI
jgi:hypothetical protein